MGNGDAEMPNAVVTEELLAELILAQNRTTRAVRAIFIFILVQVLGGVVGFSFIAGSAGENVGMVVVGSIFVLAGFGLAVWLSMVEYRASAEGLEEDPVSYAEALREVVSGEKAFDA